MISRLLTRPYFNTGWYIRLTLLIGQSLSLGVTLSLLIITANALFLVDFGPQILPYVYIVVAFAGSLLSYGVAALQRRWTLSRMAITTVAGLAVFFFLSWLGVAAWQWRWISFALIVSFSLVIQIGFVFLGSQAGRLLDLRQLKRLFPQIVAGFVVGFLLGALAVPVLVQLLGSTEHVLIGQVVSTLVWLAFLVVISRRFPAELNQMDQLRPEGGEQSFVKLLRKPYVLLIFVYQLLAAVVNQLSDFFLLAQSAQRYTSSASLAHFFSRFTAALNVTDLVITTLIAGLFLSRFGLGAGLLSNPLVMGMLFLGMLVTAPLLGLDSDLFFLLVVVARVASISLTDGTTRASVNTSYQALPARERVPIQTGVEGIGAPLALGLVGVLLLAFNAIPGLTILHLVILAVLVVAAWIAVGLKVFQGYKISLVRMIRRRALDETDFSLEDLSTLEPIQRLLRSDALPQVRQALDVLETAEHDSLDDWLIRLLAHQLPEMRAEALARIERRQTHAALPAVQEAFNSEPALPTKAAALRALVALQGAAAVEELVPYLQAGQPELRMAALVGLLRYGGIAGVLAAGQILLSLGASREPADRILAARVMGEVGAGHFYQPLLPLLRDKDLEVRLAALSAAREAPHPQLLEPIIESLSSPATRSAGMAALTAFGDGILPDLQRALAAGNSMPKDTTLRLLRVTGQMKGAWIVACLKEHIGHADDEIRHQILASLNLCAYQAESTDEPAIHQAIGREAEHGLRIILASQSVGDGEAFHPLTRALADDLAQLRQRIILLLSFQHDSQAIMQAGQRLATGSEADRALAIEILDISLPAETKNRVFPILDPNLRPAKRIEQLGKLFPLQERQRSDQLLEIIANSTGIWQNDWTRACAVYAAGMLPAPDCLPEIRSLSEKVSGVLAETAIWAAERLSATPV